MQLFNQHGQYVEKFIGDANLSKSGLQYVLSNQITLRLRDMSRLEAGRRLRGPISVRVDEEGRLYIPDYGSHRVQVYKKEAYPLTEGTDSAAAAQPHAADDVAGAGGAGPFACACRRSLRAPSHHVNRNLDGLPRVMAPALLHRRCHRFCYALYLARIRVGLRMMARSAVFGRGARGTAALGALRRESQFKCEVSP